MNDNAFYYLGASPVTQPIIEYLLALIATHQETKGDNWYHNPINFYYALGRNYQSGITQFEPVRETVFSRLLASESSAGEFGQTMLETAQA